MAKNSKKRNKQTKIKSEILYNYLRETFSNNSRFKKEQRYQQQIWKHCQKGSLELGEHDGLDQKRKVDVKITLAQHGGRGSEVQRRWHAGMDLLCIISDPHKLPTLPGRI